MVEGRILALDFGTVRIGAAISDGLGMTAQPLPYIQNNHGVWEPGFKKILAEYDVRTVLIGLPKNRDGGESAQSEVVRQFAKAVETLSGLSVVFYDERFSTAAVTKQLLSANVRRDKRKEVVDSLSAAYVLQGYLDKTVN
ncbi:MAG: Holliday junction resolvase RuvX [Candidatus Margulisiibacteriota bacterium]